MPRKKAKVDEPIRIEDEAPEPEPVEVVLEPQSVSMWEIPATVVATQSLEELAAKAWDTVKGKDDATFATCARAFRETLMYHAYAVQKTFSASEGDETNLAAFEKELLRLILEGEHGESIKDT